MMYKFTKTFNIKNKHLFKHTYIFNSYTFSDVMDHSISRGGTMRSSLQTQKRTDLNNSRRNSVHG